jgi:hypothetical protein
VNVPSSVSGQVLTFTVRWKLARVVGGQMRESLLDSYDPQSAAMQAIVVKLLHCEDANRFMGGMMGGLASRYDLGSDQPEVGHLIGDRTAGDGSLYDLMQGDDGVLLDATTDGAATALAAAPSSPVASQRRMRDVR